MLLTEPPLGKVLASLGFASMEWASGSSGKDVWPPYQDSVRGCCHQAWSPEDIVLAVESPSQNLSLRHEK